VSRGSITLGAVAAHTAVVTVACSRCDRAARYRLDRLIARHGPACGIPDVLRLLSKIAFCARPLKPVTCAAFIARSCSGSS
jgi:hypothetical protein